MTVVPRTVAEIFNGGDFLTKREQWLFIYFFYRYFLSPNKQAVNRREKGFFHRKFYGIDKNQEKKVIKVTHKSKMTD